jgi:hypothetical protein
MKLKFKPFILIDRTYIVSVESQNDLEDAVNTLTFDNIYKFCDIFNNFKIDTTQNLDIPTFKLQGEGENLLEFLTIN